MAMSTTVMKRPSPVSERARTEAPPKRKAPAWRGLYEGWRQVSTVRAADLVLETETRRQRHRRAAIAEHQPGTGDAAADSRERQAERVGEGEQSRRMLRAGGEQQFVI